VLRETTLLLPIASYSCIHTHLKQQILNCAFLQSASHLRQSPEPEKRSWFVQNPESVPGTGQYGAKVIKSLFSIFNFHA